MSYSSSLLYKGNQSFCSVFTCYVTLAYRLNSGQLNTNFIEKMGKNNIEYLNSESTLNQFRDVNT